MNFNIPSFPDLQFGTLFCIGRNYAEHIKEMKSESTADPVVFLKPRNSILLNRSVLTLPHSSENVHHEVELVLLMGETAENVSEKNALNYITGYGVGLDLTARDIQSHAKQNGLPWALSKGFRGFAPLGNFIAYQHDHDFSNLNLTVSVNNEVRQDGNTSDMIFSAATLISYLSRKFTLHPGDLIFTGTPEGVSQLKREDHVFASLNNGESSLEISVDG
jgi:2-keto-4-pentenoate hydratase/2-oxohepta-3-ene-1,7-dioic acid hydratase in catechol pathway